MDRAKMAEGRELCHRDRLEQSSLWSQLVANYGVNIAVAVKHPA